jgi:hypothetical protein
VRVPLLHPLFQMSNQHQLLEHLLLLLLLVQQQLRKIVKRQHKKNDWRT